MAVALISSSDCTNGTAGNGLVTSWELTGSATAYAGTLTTDGYKLTVSQTWKNAALV